MTDETSKPPEDAPVVDDATKPAPEPSTEATEKPAEAEPKPTEDEKAAKIAKGSGEPNKNKVGKVTQAQIEEIAKIKMDDLNAIDLKGAARIIEGTARSMGITVS